MGNIKSLSKMNAEDRRRLAQLLFNRDSLPHNIISILSSVPYFPYSETMHQSSTSCWTAGNNLSIITRYLCVSLYRRALFYWNFHPLQYSHNLDFAR